MLPSPRSIAIIKPEMADIPEKRATENYYLVCFVLVKGVLLRILLSSSSVYHVNVFIEMLLLIYEIVKPH